MLRERGVTILVVSGLLLAFMAAVYLPGRWIDCDLRSEIVRTQLAADRAPLVLMQLNAARALKEIHLTNLAESAAAIPEEPHIPEVLARLHQLARQHQLGIVRVQPQVALDFKTYQRHPLRIDVRGDFQALSAFLGALEQSERLFQFNLIDIHPLQADTQSGKLEGTVEVSVFRALNNSADSAKDSKSSGAL